MTDGAVSGVPRRVLGRALRELRTESGATLDGAAEALGWSRSRMCRIEGGGGRARGADVRAVCERYDASPDLAAGLVALAGEDGSTGWWHAYGGPLPAWFDVYAGLEADACRIREYQNGLIPALFQTPEYALRAEGRLPAGERDRVVGARLARQSLLRRTLPAPPQVEVVLSEAALVRAAGDSAIGADQLRHLLKVGLLPHVSIRVLPFAAGVCAGVLAGSFVLLDFPPGAGAAPALPVAYQESAVGALYLDGPRELATFERAWASFDPLVLDPDQSRILIEMILKEAGPDQS
ncbi:helix-turn-helix transcriptional regulator [Micromonospora sp. NPDC000207]|uniref:helix-turn-helix domain-containing protein n=1 Tax=Micromonospora sp. NPDC000207 TaxID=3154246 RepID=UPI00331DFD66